MKLTIVGAWGAYPKVSGATSTYLLEDQGFKLLIDLGSGGLMAYQKYDKLENLDALVLSHYHADHIADVGVLQHGLIVQSLLQQKSFNVSIYASDEDTEAFKKLQSDYTKGIAYHADEVLKIGPFFIRFLKTKHPVICHAMRITNGESTLVYTADSAYQNQFITFAKDADLLLAESSFYHGQNAARVGHMTSTQAASIAKDANVQSLILTHLPHFGDINQLLVEAKSVYSGQIQLAQEGLVWEK